VLFAATADVAVYNNVVVDIPTEAVVISREIVAGLFIFGLIISERIRSRFGVRVGIITAVLLAVYANTNYWLIVMYVVLFVLAFGFVQAVNYATLRYGRVLLGTTTAFALLVAVPLTLSLPIGRGLSAFFVAFLAGITAYNAHVTGSFDRRAVLPSSCRVHPGVARHTTILRSGSSRYPTRTHVASHTVKHTRGGGRRGNWTLVFSRPT